jgi:hypothetical protein
VLVRRLVRRPPFPRTKHGIAEKNRTPYLPETSEQQHHTSRKAPKRQRNSTLLFKGMDHTQPGQPQATMFPRPGRNIFS